jgi:hypothetical protein
VGVLAVREAGRVLVLGVMVARVGLGCLMLGGEVVGVGAMIDLERQVGDAVLVGE